MRLQTVFVDNNWLGFCIVAVRGLKSWFLKKYFFAQFHHKYFFVWANFFYYACKDFLDFFFKRKEPIQVIKNF